MASEEGTVTIEHTTFGEFYFGDDEDCWYEGDTITPLVDAIQSDPHAVFNQKDCNGVTLLHFLMTRSGLAFDVGDRATDWVRDYLAYRGIGAAKDIDNYGNTPIDCFVTDLEEDSSNQFTLARFLGGDEPTLGHYRHALPVLLAYREGLFSSKLFYFIAGNDDPTTFKASRAMLSMVFPNGLTDAGVPSDETAAAVAAAAEEGQQQPIIPLHIASKYACYDFVDEVFPYFISPQSAQARDSDGNLALHLVLNSCIGEDPHGRKTVNCCPFVQDLVQTYPESLFLCDHPKGRLPLEVACENDCSVGVVYFLLRRMPDRLVFTASSSSPSNKKRSRKEEQD